MRLVPLYTVVPARPRILNRRSLLPAVVFPVLLSMACSMAVHRVQGADVQFLGTVSSVASNNYAPQNWSSPSGPKEFALEGSQVYGTAGYYQIRPVATNSSTEFAEPVGATNNLGISAAADPTLSSAPVILSSITGGAGNYVNFSSYPTFLGPDGSTIYRQGSLSVSAGTGPFDTPSGTNNGYFGEAFSFTTAMAATFRVGVAVDTVADSAYAPDYVSIFNTSTGTKFSTLLARDKTPDMAFFEIDAVAGETFTAAVWQLAGANSVAPFGLITFDVVSYNFNVAAGLSETNSVPLGGAPSRLHKTGQGTLVLAASNSCAGGTLVSGGTLVMAEGSVIAGGITNNATVVFDGAHSGIANAVSGTGSLVKSGAGTATFYTPNSYTGTTVVSAGQLMLGGSGTIPVGSVVEIGAGASVNLTGFFAPTNINRTIAGLSGAGILYGVGGTVTVAKVSGSDTFSGDIQGGQGLIKEGGGTLVLAGNVSYSGTTEVTAGALGVGGNLGSSLVSVRSGAALGLDSVRSVTTSGGVSFSPGAGVSVSGTPTGLSVTLLTASGGISGSPSLSTPVLGYELVVNANSLVLQASGTTFSGWLGTNAPTPQLLTSYAFGAVSPTNSANPSNLPAYGTTNGQFVLNYSVRADDTNLVVEPQVNENLTVSSGWTAGGISNSVIGMNVVDGVEMQQRQAAVPLTGGKKFLRLKITE